LSSAPAEGPFARCPIGIVASELDGVTGEFPGRFDGSDSETDSQCCYDVCGPERRSIRGRPAHDDHGAMVLAGVVETDAWSLPDLAIRSADVTVADARLEHASIAAFARLSLSLLAFGAPPDLVEDCHRAALDEIRHAQISFTLAGAALGPAPSRALADLRAHRSLADLAEETYRDGCIGETIASLDLHAIAPDMAADEARHAELGWRIVEWALASRDEEVRARIEHATREMRRRDDALARWAYANVIEPCTNVLLSEAA
jgi:hypothetical protein